MGYRLEPAEALPAGLQRIVCEQIDDAVEELGRPAEEREEAVHEARKCFKKIRAVIRLVRDELPRPVYKRENACFRDAGRNLAEARDSAVRGETLDKLTERFACELAQDAFADLRAVFCQQHQEASQRLLEEGNTAEETVAVLCDARTRVAGWTDVDDRFCSVHDGLKRVYKRGRNGMDAACDDPTAENFHEWRKRVKYLWYHTRLLRPVWPKLMKTLASQIHDLANVLGDDHDLAELGKTVAAIEAAHTEEERDALLALIDRRQQDLRASARPLGARVYAEKPSALVDRVGTYWDVMRGA